MNDLMINVVYPFSESFLDYPDNESHCITIYCMGCDNSCKDCQNKEFKDATYTTNKTKIFSITEFIQEIYKSTSRSHTNKIVLCGGDFLSHYNINFTKELLLKIGDVFDICIYTGHSMQYCYDNKISGFSYIKCGNYIPELKQETYKTDDIFSLASSNQAIYDKQYSLLTKNGILTFN